MDEYQIEIRDLRRTLARLEADEAAPELIAEYEAEVRIHSALYRAAQETFAAGLDDTAMRDALASLGFGGWTLGNVYSFVYDLAMELPSDAGRDLAAVIDETDFAGSLLESVRADEG